MADKFILITSFKKMEYENNEPTGKLHREQSYVNIDSIELITRASTYINEPQLNLDYYEEGSIIHLTCGATLTSIREPKILVDHIQAMMRENQD